MGHIWLSNTLSPIHVWVRSRQRAVNCGIALEVLEHDNRVTPDHLHFVAADEGGNCLSVPVQRLPFRIAKQGVIRAHLLKTNEPTRSNSFQKAK